MMLMMPIMALGALAMALLLPSVFRLLGVDQATRPTAQRETPSPAREHGRERRLLERQNNDARF
jgi:hypothetical protein